MVRPSSGSAGVSALVFVGYRVGWLRCDDASFLGGEVATVSSRIVKPSRPDNSPQSTGSDYDGYLDRVAKYIPAEIAAAYLTLQNVVALGTSDSDGMRAVWLAIVFVGLEVVNVFYLRARASNGAVRDPWWITQYVISGVAFAAWVYALQVLPTSLGIFSPILAAILLVFVTLIAGVLARRADDSLVPQISVK